MCHVGSIVLIGLCSLPWAGPAPAHAGEPVGPDLEIVKLPLDRVPPEWRHRVDPCAIDREADGRYAVLHLSEREIAGLKVPHRRLGRLSDHLRRFLPVKTLQKKDIPSLTRLLGLPPGGPAGGPPAGGAPRGGPSRLAWDEYHTRQEGVDFIQTLAATFPDIAQAIVLGQTIEGRDLWALKITDNPTEEEPEEERILFTGVTHAREWATHEMMLYMAEYLTNRYGSDALVTRIIDNAVVWLVPVVNPDGFDYTWSDDRMWRKNRRPVGEGCVGVDINRNYAYGWGGDGSSGWPWSGTYRGPEPASELETQTIQSLLAQEKPAIAVSFHTYSQLVLYAWGHTEAVTPESYTAMRAVGNRYADLVEQVHGERYLPGQSSYTIYVTSGAFDDHAYGAEGLLAFTPELRPESTEQGGFMLPEDQILPNNEENMAAAMWMMVNVADAADILNPASPTLIESPALGDNFISLSLPPVNQKPSLALGFDPLFQDQLETWLDDAEHDPPRWGTLIEDFEGCGPGSGYVLEITPELRDWAEGLTSYRGLPGLFDLGAEVMLSNVESGFNLIGIPSAESVWMQDISVIQRVLVHSGNTFGYGEEILEERTALEDMNHPEPWINWTWLYLDSSGLPHYAHPLGGGGVDAYVHPFRAYYVLVNVPSSSFGSTSVPVYLLRFPARFDDCNNNGFPDIDDIITGTSLDCNGNGVPDDCEYPACEGILPGDLDCSGVADGGDLQGFVDYLVTGRYTCQADMNGDGVVDIEDIPLFVVLLLGG